MHSSIKTGSQKKDTNTSVDNIFKKYMKIPKILYYTWSVVNACYQGEGRHAINRV